MKISVHNDVFDRIWFFLLANFSSYLEKLINFFMF